MNNGSSIIITDQEILKPYIGAENKNYNNTIICKTKNLIVIENFVSTRIYEIMKIINEILKTLGMGLKKYTIEIRPTISVLMNSLVRAWNSRA